jgi:hypothetical protein
MRREHDRELERRLAELPIPGEAEAEERSWEMVRAAYAERTPVRPTYRARRLAIAAAVGAALLAIGLSPAGAKVGDWVRDVVGEEDAKPELKTLPAAGQILVEGADGVWIVRDDGSKRRLGDYDEATWSPNGVFIAVTDGSRLLAVTPEGEVRWDVEAAATVHDPRWVGTETDTRVAYRSGGDLWVVAGDGTGPHVVARDVAPVAPAWRPLVDTKLGGFSGHVLVYRSGSGEIRAVHADLSQEIPNQRGDARLLHASEYRTGAGRLALAPSDRSSARVRTVRGRSELVLPRQAGIRKRVLFSAPGPLTGPNWSPDSRWLLIGWPRANQWLFINADDPTRVKPFENIAEQFGGVASRPGDFPSVAGWELPQR